MTSKERTLTNMTQAILSMPVLPVITTKILGVIGSPDYSAQRLSQLIESDPQLTAKVLRTANSAFYGLPRKVYTVQQAVVLLGENRMLDIGLSLSLGGVLRVDVSGSTGIWRHALGVALGSQMIAKSIPSIEESKAYVAGLLHDIGQWVLCQYATKEFLSIQKLMRFSEESRELVEKKMLGVTHSDVGGWLLEHWKLPNMYVETAKHHEQPERSTTHMEMCLVVALASYIADNIGLGTENYIKTRKLSEHTLSLLDDQFGIQEGDFPDYMEELKAVYKAKQSSLSL